MQVMYVADPQPHWEICCAMPGMTLATVRCAAVLQKYVRRCGIRGLTYMMHACSLAVNVLTWTSSQVQVLGRRQGHRAGRRGGLQAGS